MIKLYICIIIMYTFTYKSIYHNSKSIIYIIIFYFKSIINVIMNIYLNKNETYYL